MSEQQTIETIYLQSAIKRLLNYKDLAEKTFQQLEEKDLFYQPNEASNSIALIIQHMAGNMLSRWTNFLTEDGEKEWRSRDAEFENQFHSRKEVMELWEKGWVCLLDSLKSLKPDDLLKTIHIRSEPLIVLDAINRQFAHYPHHVGQILFIGKLIKNNDWKSLSIPKGQSDSYNQQMKSGK